ncbi:MAG: transglutaminase-like domain-containing protein [Thermodesulfobacteriota bacterium]
MPSRATIFRIAVLVLWGILLVLLLRREYFIETIDRRESEAVAQARQENWLGIHFNGERIGYVHDRLLPEGDGYRLHQEARLNLNILGEQRPVRMAVVARLDPAMLLQDFSFSFATDFYQMEAEGRVEGDAIRYTLSNGKDRSAGTIPLRAPPFIATGQRHYLLAGKPAVGDRVRLPFFDPLTLSGKDSVLEYRGREKVLIEGRVYLLHHFREQFSGIWISSWLDDDGQVVKEESPAGFVFLREPEFRAMDIGGTKEEMLGAVAVTPPRPLPDDAAARERLSYRLILPAEPEFRLDSHRQTLSGDILTVRREPLPAADAAPCAEPAALAASAYIQADHPDIAALARQLTANTDTALARTRHLAAWVFATIEKRPVLGIPDALATLRSKTGDCNEHAALFAALARAAGIPARIIAGVVHQAGKFYYHAWNEVCLGGAWLSLDTTRDQLPADVTHIGFASGEMDELLAISSLIGKLRIEAIEP